MVNESNQPVKNKEIKNLPIFKIIHIRNDSTVCDYTISSNARSPCDHNGCTI